MATTPDDIERQVLHAVSHDTGINVRSVVRAYLRTFGPVAVHQVDHKRFWKLVRRYG